MKKFKIQKLLHLFLPLMGVGGSLFFLFACSKGLLTHKAAREAAESYYQMLIKGDFRGFASGYAHMENMPADYLDQLEDATAQFMSEEPMRDLIAVSVLSDSLGEDSTAFVMLQLQFSDSIFEEIQVPLILGEDGWKMMTP